MEIKLSTEKRRHTAAPEPAARGEAPARPTALQAQIRDRLELSQAALAVAQQISKPETDGLWSLLNPRKDDAKTQAEVIGEAMSEAMEVMKLCSRIAARIRKGDRVPQKDLRYLLQHDPNLYLMATIMQEANDDPKKWDSLIPEDEAEQAQADGDVEAAASGPGSAPSVESSGVQGGAPSGGSAPSGGGEGGAPAAG